MSRPAVLLINPKMCAPHSVRLLCPDAPGRGPGGRSPWRSSTACGSASHPHRPATLAATPHALSVVTVMRDAGADGHRISSAIVGLTRRCPSSGVVTFPRSIRKRRSTPLRGLCVAAGRTDVLDLLSAWATRAPTDSRIRQRHHRDRGGGRSDWSAPAAPCTISIVGAHPEAFRPCPTIVSRASTPPAPQLHGQATAVHKVASVVATGAISAAWCRCGTARPAG